MSVILWRHQILFVPRSFNTATVPAVQAAVKTELSYRKDTILAVFFAANKNKDNAKVPLTSSNS